MGVQTSESCDLSIILLVMQKPTATFLFLFSCFFFPTGKILARRSWASISYKNSFLRFSWLQGRKNCTNYNVSVFFLPFFWWIILCVGCLPFGPCPFCPHVLNPNSEFSFSPLQIFLTYIVLHIPISLVEMLKLPISC